ncbi:AtuA-related protein [Streptantibioticus ferralitis]|uniref:AtuA-like ferredoxin-fold domain-containing protein n=1 Tax=Streptantibioticus ferralitis TaxID=236510 RepID=A0ABT5ZCQ0_9ACTN|nr:hypothetical protein [Streptantibioticus ferralitis]MDF2261463.1 hypothetical protein [Streptantibioticus ferralitis]
MTPASAPGPTLRELAPARAGDKGRSLTLTVVARNAANYPMLRAGLTAAAVREHLSPRISGDVHRYEMPATATLLFLSERTPDDSVNTSLHRDRHGKTLSGLLLDLPIPTEPTTPSRSLEST